MLALTIAGAAVAATAILSWPALAAWRGWLDLRRFGIAKEEGLPELPDRDPALRIEMASMKERLRRLEALANGIDL